MYRNIFAHYYGIDTDNDIVTHNDDQAFLDNVRIFVEEKMSNLYFSDSNRQYKIKDTTTQVLTNIKSMITTNDSLQRISFGDIIAKRLLSKEKDVQSRITQLEQDVQKGGLVITCFEQDSVKYYAVVKIHYIDFYEENTFDEKRGLPKKHVILKTSICKINGNDIDDDFFLSDSTKPKGQGAAKFWWDDFLELKQLINDTENTKKAFTKVEELLKSEFKEDLPSYWYFRNNLVSYLRSEEQFVFNTMIQRTIGILDIEPLDGKSEAEKEAYKQALEAKIRAVQMKNGEREFDTEFTVDSKEVKARIKRTIPLITNVDLSIRGEIPDFKNKIVPDIDSGRKCLKIYTDTGYEEFKKSL